jgi:2-polyprenyl-3-methyl-5-hydroxy-6-metoxy-1,4-benzoquinol methylase
MNRFELPHIDVPEDMRPEEMPDLLRYWYLGTKARRHMVLRRFAEVDGEIHSGGRGRILDIGSAWGYNVMALSRLGVAAVGMDLVTEPFGVGKRIAAANGVDLCVIGADVSDLPFGEGEFSGITMVETLEHVFEEDRGKAVAECHRVLTPGGRLVFSTPNYGSLVERLKRAVVRFPRLRRVLPTMCYPAGRVARSDYHPHQYHQPWGDDRITQELETAGFNILKIKRFLFVVKNTPDSVFPAVAVLERLLEKTPLVRRLAATVCVVAEKK